MKRMELGIRTLSAVGLICLALAMAYFGYAVMRLANTLPTFTHQIPELVAEIKAAREAIPPTLDRLEKMVAESKSIASNAGENAVTGFFTGIFKAPFNLVTELQDTLLPTKDLSDDERDAILKIQTKLVNQGELHDKETFKDPDAELKAEVEITALTHADDKQCKLLKTSIWRAKQTLDDVESKICLDKDGKWSVEK